MVALLCHYLQISIGKLNVHNRVSIRSLLSKLLCEWIVRANARSFAG